MSAATPLYDAAVIGGSAGAFEVLQRLLGALPLSTPLRIAVTVHLPARGGATFANALGASCAMPVCLARDKEPFAPGRIYLAPPNYHLLIEPDGHLALSVEPPVHYCRPAIDVLFESAARALCPALVGVLLTGANADGAEGLAAVACRGGVTVVQSPATAVAPTMPEAALRLFEPDHLLPPDEIAPLLLRLNRTEETRRVEP